MLFNKYHHSGHFNIILITFKHLSILRKIIFCINLKNIDDGYDNLNHARSLIGKFNFDSSKTVKQSLLKFASIKFKLLLFVRQPLYVLVYNIYFNT